MAPRTLLLISSDEPEWADIRTVLQTLPAVEVVGDATSPAQAQHLASTHRPDLILAAAAVAGASTVPLLCDLHRHDSPLSRLVVFADSVTPAELIALSGLNVRGYLLWNDLSADILRHALTLVIEGDLVVSSRAVAQAYVATQQGSLRPSEPLVHVTARERSVLTRLAEGLTQEQIARLAGLSRKTVERVVASLETKLGAPSQFVLGLKVAQLGLLH